MLFQSVAAKKKVWSGQTAMAKVEAGLMAVQEAGALAGLALLIAGFALWRGLRGWAWRGLAGLAAALALIGTVIAFWIWPAADVEVLAHTHDDLPRDHPHLLEGHPGGRARHAFVIDELHPRWPIA